MFRVHETSFPIKSATFDAIVDYSAEDDGLEVTWFLDVTCESVHVGSEVWHPNLHLEEVGFSIDDPLTIEHSDVAIAAGEGGDGRSSLFLAGKDYAWDLRATFGARTGNTYDVLIAGTAWDAASETQTALRIMTPIAFGGLNVWAESMAAARIAIDRLTLIEEYVAEQDGEHFRFTFPETV